MGSPLSLCDFPGKQVVKHCYKLGHEHFFPCLFQFIINSHAVVWCCITYAVNKPLLNEGVVFILYVFQPSSVLTCFCTWLVTALDDCISTDLKLELNSALQHHIWSQQQVESLLEEAVSAGHVTTLARGFILFLPVSK